VFQFSVFCCSVVVRGRVLEYGQELQGGFNQSQPAFIERE
jgi:hypothetical protein